MLQQTFIELTRHYTSDAKLQEELWSEIEKKYSGKKRHYHTLSHLNNLLKQLSEIKDQIADWNTILFSVFYHDIIYNTLKQDNEEKSSKLAGKRLASLNVSEPLIEKCKQHIIATKLHQLSHDTDTNLFTDADLAILGTDWNSYKKYYQQIRKEYSIYPDMIYNPGRKKVLHHFLHMERIYKTVWFYNRYEQQAIINLEKELNCYK